MGSCPLPFILHLLLDTCPHGTLRQLDMPLLEHSNLHLGHIKLILSFSPAPDFSARVGPHEYQMGGVWGRVLASRDQIDTSLRSLYIAGTINR